MLLLAKILAVVVLVWFFVTAQDHKQPAIQWAVIGLIGYITAWGLGYAFVHLMLPAAITRTMTMGFLVMQIPAIFGGFAAYVIRGKLIANAKNAEA